MCCAAYERGGPDLSAACKAMGRCQAPTGLMHSGLLPMLMGANLSLLQLWLAIRQLLAPTVSSLGVRVGQRLLGEVSCRGTRVGPVSDRGGCSSALGGPKARAPAASCLLCKGRAALGGRGVLLWAGIITSTVFGRFYVSGRWR